MLDLLQSFTSFRFLQYALVGGLLCSVAAGMIGTYVVVRRISFMAGGIAHAVLGGMGAALFFNQAPFHGALLMAVITAMLIGWISMRWKAEVDTLISATWAGGMAIGVLFITATPGYNVDLMSYLFGNILLITEANLLMTATLDIILVGLILLFHKTFEAVVFDEEFARLRGIPVTQFYFLLLVTVALTVVLMIQLVGLILVIALLTLPPAIGQHYLNSLAHIMLFAVLSASVFTSSGIVIAFETDMPAGSIIILITVLAFFLSTILHNRILQRKKSNLRPNRYPSDEHDD